MSQAEQPDQAAGLRRRSARMPPACIYCFFDTTEWTERLATALHHAGRHSLLIDRQGRLFAVATTRSLFDWKRQLERGELHTLSLSHGDGWYAPGLRADAPALREVARQYDHLLFDEEASGADLILMPDASNRFLVEVQPGQSSMLRAYTLLKSLSHAEAGSKVSLLGDADACLHVLDSVKRFLPQPFAQAIDFVAHVDTAFSTLAVRMPCEETSCLTRSTIENTRTWP
jgi:ATP-dependent exoDNAse (exonuclease V) alpha subunit